jgi:hypothetical protein
MLALLVGFNNTVNLNTVSMQEDYCGWDSFRRQDVDLLVCYEK